MYIVSTNRHPGSRFLLFGKKASKNEAQNDLRKNLGLNYASPQELILKTVQDKNYLGQGFWKTVYSIPNSSYVLSFPMSSDYQLEYNAQKRKNAKIYPDIELLNKEESLKYKNEKIVAKLMCKDINISIAIRNDRESEVSINSKGGSPFEKLGLARLFPNTLELVKTVLKEKTYVCTFKDEIIFEIPQTPYHFVVQIPEYQSSIIKSLLYPDKNFGQYILELGPFRVGKAQKGQSLGASELTSNIQKRNKYEDSLYKLNELPQSVFDRFAEKLLHLNAFKSSNGKGYGLRPDVASPDNVLLSVKNKSIDQSEINLIDLIPRDSNLTLEDNNLTTLVMAVLMPGYKHIAYKGYRFNPYDEISISAKFNEIRKNILGKAICAALNTGLPLHHKYNRLKAPNVNTLFLFDLVEMFNMCGIDINEQEMLAFLYELRETYQKPAKNLNTAIPEKIWDTLKKVKKIAP